MPPQESIDRLNALSSPVKQEQDQSILDQLDSMSSLVAPVESPSAGGVETPTQEDETPPASFKGPEKIPDVVGQKFMFGARVSSAFASRLIETNLPTKEERAVLPNLRNRLIGFNEPLASRSFDFQPQRVTPEVSQELKEASQDRPETPLERVARVQRSIQGKLALPLAETPEEKVAEALGGLGAFVTRLAILNKTAGLPLKSIPRGLRAPVIWEAENQLSGGPPGQGAAMSIGLTAISALPVREGLKFGLESVGFGVLQGDADEVDIYIAMAIPGFFRAGRLLKTQDHSMQTTLGKKIRDAKTPEELTDALEGVAALAEKFRKDNNIPEDVKPTEAQLSKMLVEYNESLTPAERKAKGKATKKMREMIFPGEDPKPQASKVEPSKPLAPDVLGRIGPTGFEALEILGKKIQERNRKELEEEAKALKGQPKPSVEITPEQAAEISREGLGIELPVLGVARPKAEPLPPSKDVQTIARLRGDLDTMPIESLVDVAVKMGMAKPREGELSDLNRAQLIAFIDSTISASERINLPGADLELNKKNIEAASMTDLHVIARQLGIDTVRTSVGRAGIEGASAKQITADRKFLEKIILQEAEVDGTKDLRLTKLGLVVPSGEPTPQPVRVIKPTAPAPRKPKPTTPTVITRVGPKREAVVENDKLDPKVAKKSRPLRFTDTGDKGFQEFLPLWEKGQIVIPKKLFALSKDPNDPRVMFDLLVKDGRIKARVVAKPDVIPESQGPLEGKLPLVGVAVERPPEITRMLEIQAEAIQRLPEHQRMVLEGIRGLNNRPQKTLDELATLLDIPKDRVLELENLAEKNIRIAMGKDLPDATVESSYRATDPGPHRRGFMLFPPVMIVQASPVLIKPFRALGEGLVGAGRFTLGKLLSLEARSMIQNVRLYGGKFSNGIADMMNTMVDQQLAYSGGFQTDQVKAQKTLNRIAFSPGNTAMSDVQSRPLSKKGVVYETSAKDGSPLPVAGEVWSKGKWHDLIEGFLEPANKSEAEIVDVAGRQPALKTGHVFEGVGLRIKVGNGSILFKTAEGGKKALAISNYQFHDILLRGPDARDFLGRPDGLWHAYETAAMELNPGKITSRALARGVMESLQKNVARNYPGSGYRHVGAELAREFPRRPTHLKANNGRIVPVEVTHPRKYMDSVYMTSAMRAGFVQFFGQDGKEVQKLRDLYVGDDNYGPRGSGRGDVFDNAVRTLSDVPPLWRGHASFSAMSSPGSWTYNQFRGVAAGLEIVKQGLLSKTAIIQPSEILAFMPQSGLKETIKAMRDLARHPLGKDIIMDELVRMRGITKNVLDMTIDKSRAKTSFANLVAGVMNRAFGNKFANEIFNEGIAGRAAYFKIMDIAKRGKDKEPPTNSDIHYLRLLEYPVETAKRLASGGGSNAEYEAAIRRAVRFAVGSTAIRPQRSPLQNTRAYLFMIPFTRFFSNRMRTFDLLFKVSAEDTERAIKNPSKENLKKAGRSHYELSTAFVGATAAGVVAGYLASLMREGVSGIGQKTRELRENPVDFLLDMFRWGTFGPVYGAFWDGLFEGSGTEGSAEGIFIKIGRATLPTSEAIDLVDAQMGWGQFRNMSWLERQQKYLRDHLPIMGTAPFMNSMRLLGMQGRDPKTDFAVREFWTWMYNPDNESVPASGGSPRFRTGEAKQKAIHLRRATEALDAGRDPFPHLVKAFEAAGGAIDMKSALLSQTLLDRPELNDEKRRAMARVLGPDKMRIIWERDLMYRFLAEQADVMFGVGKEIKALQREMENIELEATTIKP